MAIQPLDLASEQRYFDAAWDAREKARASLRAASRSAASAGAAAHVRKQAAAMAETLGRPDDPVAFGRIDSEDESIYVGMHSLTDENKDLLVIGWKAPLAAPFYEATPKNPLGLLRQRKFATSKNRITDFEDAVYRDLAKRIDELDEAAQFGIDDAVLGEMERGRSTQLQQIVQTIHQAQYDLIRHPLAELMVVQGAPGTGKTVVALHRVSWLLYNDPSLSPDQVLVVGPSRAFTQYVQSVLPSLGDEGVRHLDLKRLGPITSDNREESDDVGRLKGQGRMAALLEAALEQRIRRVEVPIRTNRGGHTVSRDIIEEFLEGRRGTYSERRQDLRVVLQDQLAKQGPRHTAAAQDLDSALDRVMPSLSAQQFLQDLLGSRQRLSAAAGDLFTAADVERLYRPSAGSLGQETWSDTDVLLLDEAENLLTGVEKPYRHIVVDEAQDLSPMQLRAVRRRSLNGSYTLVGDIAQSTGLWARADWSDVVALLQTDNVATTINELEFGYRVPRQIYELAARLLPAIAPDLVPPKVIRDGDEPLIIPVAHAEVARRVVAEARRLAGDGLMVGVIAPDDTRTSVEELFHDAKVRFSKPADGLGQSINLMSPLESKGLEFDAIVVAEPAAIASDPHAGQRLLYVALTRSTKLLTIVYSQNYAPLGLGDGSQPDPESVESGQTQPAPEPLNMQIPVVVARSGAANPLLMAMAGPLADQIRSAVRPEVYEDLLELIRRELQSG